MNLKISLHKPFFQNLFTPPSTSSIILINNLDFIYVYYLIGKTDLYGEEIFHEGSVEAPTREKINIHFPIPNGLLERWQFHIFGYERDCETPKHYILNVADIRHGMELDFESSM